MAAHKVLIFCPYALSLQGEEIEKAFAVTRVCDEAEILAAVKQDAFKVVVVDMAVSQDLDLSYCEKLLSYNELKDMPLVLLTRSQAGRDKLKAFEIGCDDFIESVVSPEETCARITRSIFHRIATEQISSRLEIANQAAHSAMVDNSDLGANLQFLLSVHNCDNLDELGQQFFSIIERYGLKCSLQMRSVMGDKNMEAHGMAKDLETQLLSQMAESGRYVDFGKRTICNYDKVSLLIKNMPVDDMEKYGAIKDNTFCLVQGLNARIHALEDKYRIEQEKEALKRLSQDVKTVMVKLKDSYQDVMRSIANQVESTSNIIQDRIPALALMEYDESFLENALNKSVKETNRIFNEGLVVDEVFQRLEATIEKSLKNAEKPADKLTSIAKVDEKKPDGGSPPVELF